MVSGDWKMLILLSKSLQGSREIKPKWCVLSRFQTLLWPVARWLLCPWGFPERMGLLHGRYFLLQKIFPDRGSNHISFISCIADRFFPAKPLGKPKIMYIESFYFLKIQVFETALAVPEKVKHGSYHSIPRYLPKRKKT